MRYTTYSIQEGCCGHLHESIQNARECIDMHLRESPGPDAGTSRVVRVVEGVHNLYGFDEAQGPGLPLRFGADDSTGYSRKSTIG